MNWFGAWIMLTIGAVFAFALQDENIKCHGRTMPPLDFALAMVAWPAIIPGALIAYSLIGKPHNTKCEAEAP